jgi:hypothetical protein
MELTQVKATPGAHSEMRQVAGGTRGCLMRTRVPTAGSLPSSSLALWIEPVHCGQRSTSLSTRHTLAAGAKISTWVSMKQALSL